MLDVRGSQNLTACGRQLRHGRPDPRLGWLRRRLWMQNFVLEPVSEIGRAATLAALLILLALACGAARRAFDANVKMIVVPVIRPHLGQPAAIALRLTAKR